MSSSFFLGLSTSSVDIVVSKEMEVWNRLEIFLKYQLTMLEDQLRSLLPPK